MIERARLLGVAVVLAAGSVMVPSSAEEVTCADPEHAGGAWPMLNHDFSNSRHQPAEQIIGPANVADLEPDWTFLTAEAGGSGTLRSTPIISEGCLYVGSNLGWVFALNADSGHVVWSRQLQGELVGLGAFDGRLFAFPHLGAEGPHVVALDQFTGEILWQSERLVPAERHRDGSWMHASPIVFDGVLFAPMSLGWGAGSRVPLFFFDAATGEVLKEMYVLTDAEYEAGYGGVGVWTTGAIDTDEKVLYVGSADPEAFGKHHRYNQAVLKIDFDRNSPTFATVLDAYRGVQERYADQYAPFDRSPLCEMFGQGEERGPLGGTSTSSDNACLELDLDFGASPNLYLDSEGNQRVSILQKAGVFHSVFTDIMDWAWMRVLSPPLALGNAATAAYDGTNLYATANPGNVFSIDKDDGFINWASNTGGDPAGRYQPITVANGVLYTVSTTGALVAMDTETGLPLLHRPMRLDLGASCTTQGGGVAIARNIVYAQCDSIGGIVTYRLPT